MMKTFTKDKLTVKCYDSRNEMGKGAAEDAAAKIAELLKSKQELNIIFAAAPSQNEFLAALIADKRIDWKRINAFHMDEYVGFDIKTKQSFAYFLHEAIFGKVPFKSVNYLNGATSPEKECIRYANLLKEHPVDIVCMGIGENGHIAFNDPAFADFNDKQAVKIVALDPVCRQQQVNDKCFPTLDKVPTHAFTLTIPTLVAADYLFCVVPAKTKAEAAERAINGPISENCPASILRTHNHAVMYLDNDSSALLK